MKYTSNYNLKKPDYTDPADIQDVNDNADIIDQKLKENADNLLNLINTKMDKKIADESYSDRKYEFTVIEGKPYLRTVN